MARKWAHLLHFTFHCRPLFWHKFAVLVGLLCSACCWRLARLLQSSVLVRLLFFSMVCFGFRYFRNRWRGVASSANHDSNDDDVVLVGDIFIVSFSVTDLVIVFRCLCTCFCYYYCCRTLMVVVLYTVGILINKARFFVFYSLLFSFLLLPLFFGKFLPLLFIFCN